MSKKWTRFAGIVLSGSILVSGLGLSACKKSSSKKKNPDESETHEEIEEKESTEESEESESSTTRVPSSFSTLPKAPSANSTSDPSDPSSPSTPSAPMTPKDEALARAYQLGIPESDLREKYELFLKYCDVIDKNAALFEFRGYVYHLFPIVADNLKSENEEYFFKQLANLNFVIKPIDGNAAASYAPWANQVTVGTHYSSSSTVDQDAGTIYHELIHFIDYSIEPGACTVVYVNDKIGVYEELSDTDKYHVQAFLSTSVLTEGGAELFMAKYLTHTPLAVLYSQPTSFVAALEYIIGSEAINELFFSYDTPARFAKLLSENGFSDKEIKKVMNASSAMTYMTNSDDSISLQDVLIRLYTSYRSTDFKEDPGFLNLLQGVNRDSDKTSSENADAINSFDNPLDRDNNQFVDYIASLYTEEAEVTLFYQRFIPTYVDGKLWYMNNVSVFCPHSGTYDNFALQIDYDFSSKTIVSANRYGEWLPKDPIPKISVDNATQASALRDQLLNDNSEAHNQKDRYGEISDLKDLYDRAMEIGNRYGVEIYIADLVTEDRFHSGEAKQLLDKETISSTLDTLDSVLSLYPEDYFDQMAFSYFSGIRFYIYGGKPDTWSPETIYEPDEQKYYHSIFLNVSEEDKVFGMKQLREKYFSQFDTLTCNLISEIWRVTEKYFRLYNEHFSDPFFTEDKWCDGANYPYCNYAGDTLDALLDHWEQDTKMEYFLIRECLVSEDTDRTLMNAYMMLTALSMKNEGNLTSVVSGPNVLDGNGNRVVLCEALTPECQKKAEYLFGIVRHIFDTTNWPDIK